MIDHKKISYVLAQYQKLCHYCDTMFQAARQAYQNDIYCAKGCAECCLLETVAPLEAHTIAMFLKESPQQAVSPQDTRCIFLLPETETCSIYSVRPLICRTHGLPMTYPDHPEIDICPRNFPDSPDAIPVEAQYIMDADIITTHLMKLNLAFCMLSEQPELAEQRITLVSLLQGDVHV